MEHLLKRKCATFVCKLFQQCMSVYPTDMNGVIDLTSDEEKTYPTSAAGIKLEKTGVIVVDLTMSESPRKRKPEPAAAKVNRITNYFSLSPMKKPKNEVIELDDSRPSSPSVKMIETTMINETPVSALNTSECFYTASKSSAASSSAKDSGAGYTTASSSSAGRPSLATLNTALTYNEGAVCTTNLTPSVSFEDAMAAGRSSRGSNSSDKRHRSPPIGDLTTRSTLQMVHSSSPQYDIARKNLFCVSSEDVAETMPQFGLKSLVYSAALKMDTLRKHDSSQQETSVAVTALLEAKSPPPQPLPANTAVAHTASMAMEVINISDDVEAEVQAPRYGAHIAQRLLLMHTASRQCVAFLHSVRTAKINRSIGTGTHASVGSSTQAAARPVKDTARIKKRVDLLDKMLFLGQFAEESTIDYSLMDTAMIHAKMVFRESPNSPGMVKLMHKALKECKESSTRVYLLLIECKCAVLKERSAGSVRVHHQRADFAGFDMLGLGQWERVSNLLRRLFHMSCPDEEPPTTGPASSSAAPAAPAAVTSKSSQRKAANDKMHSVLAGDSATSMGASKVRTANDAKRAIAEEESTDSALGMRILSVWGAYMTHIRRTPAAGSMQVVIDKVIGVVKDLKKLIVNLKQPRTSPIMGASRSKSKAPETTQERDARLAADALTELCAEMVATLSAQHSDNADTDPSTASDRIVCEAMALQNVFVPYDDWIEVQESKSKASSVEPVTYIHHILKELQEKCESVLTDWYTLSVGESTLYFVAAQLCALVDRAVQCIVSTEQTEPVAGGGGDCGGNHGAGGDSLHSVLEALEDSTALQRLSVHVQRLCYSLLSKLRVTLHPMTYTRPMSDLLSPSRDSLAVSHCAHDTSFALEEAPHAAEVPYAPDTAQVEHVCLRTAYDSLLQAVSAGLHQLNEGNRDSGVSCGSNSSAGTTGSAKGRNSPDDRLLELVTELSLK